MTQNRTCEGCKYGWLLDYGYSNYTVEGTTFACAKSLHPEGSFDRFYGEDWRLSFAEKCSGFEPGEAIWVDVDEENLADLTFEQKEIFENVMKGLGDPNWWKK